MEFFTKTMAVTLRSHHNKYLIGDDDLETVRQSRNGSTGRSRWTVEMVEGKSHVVRLKSVHGRYLTATDMPFLFGMTGQRVVQAAAADHTAEWEPMRDGVQVKLKSWCGKLLRANGGTPPWNNTITHDDPHRSMTQRWVFWDVEAVEVSESDSLSEYLSAMSSFSAVSDELLSSVSADFIRSQPGSLLSSGSADFIGSKPGSLLSSVSSVPEYLLAMSSFSAVSDELLSSISADFVGSQPGSLLSSGSADFIGSQPGSLRNSVSDELHSSVSGDFIGSQPGSPLSSVSPDFIGSQPGTPVSNAKPVKTFIKSVGLSIMWTRSPKVAAFKPQIDFDKKFKTGMEAFENAKSVRLRSHHGKYLHADEDEESVTQDSNGASNNVKWSVEIVPDCGTQSIIRLKSCYGRYLTASSDHFLLGLTGRKVLQTVSARLGSSVEWEPIRDGSRVKLKTRYGNYLRANGGLPPYRNSVTHDVPHRTVTQDWILWDVDVVDIKVQSPTAQLSIKYSNFSRQESSVCLPKCEGRTIYYQIADENGDVEEGVESCSLTFKGNDVEELTKRLKKETGLEEIIVCRRHPLNKKLFPMRLQLPPNTITMRLVLVPSSSIS